MLVDLGVRHAFGVSGDAIAPLCSAMCRAGIELVHARHEGGAAFMAAEAHFITEAPVVLFTTAGPGASNAIAGLVSAAWDGAKLIAITGTDPQPRGLRESFDISGWVGDGSTSLRSVVESERDIPRLGEQLARGLAQPGGLVASVRLPLSAQLARAAVPRRLVVPSPVLPRVSAEQLERVLLRLRAGSFVIWLGHGARSASAAIRELAERSRAPVVCSPAAKGVFPESHPQYLGVAAALGGHPQVLGYFAAHTPDHVLVLGSRLDRSSGFDPLFEPRRGFIHVDIDPSVFGAAYPEVETFGVTADVRELVEALVERWPEPASPTGLETGRETGRESWSNRQGPMHPRSLLAAVQRVVVQRSNALVMAEVTPSLAWANAELRFDSPGRYRTSAAFGSATKISSGVVGAALASRGTAVGLVSDGAMLMGNELSTAVEHRANAKWIVLNTAAHSRGTFARIDFELMAVALGATGLRVRRPDQLDAALELMLATPGPVVVDVDIDPDRD